MSNLHTSLETLRAQCEDEVIRFYKQGVKESLACYELFKHALQNNNPSAFAIIYRTYEPQVRSWVLQHSQFSLTRQPIEHFVSAAYTSFYATLRGKPLANFPTVSNLLGYLKTCVHTAIFQDLRTERKHHLEDELLESTVAKPTDANRPGDELWQRMCAVVPDEKDQLLMHCSFIEDRKPAEIATLYPQDWPSARAVSIELYRIRKLLRNDPIIRGLAGLDNA